MKNLVVDTNCFLHNLQKLKFISSDKNVYTTNSVMNEVVEFEKKQEIKMNFPFLKIKSPSTSSINFVRSFSKKTGDFISLSSTDLEVIALAVDIIKEEKEGDLLRKVPKKVTTIQGGEKDGKTQEMLGWGGDFGSDDEQGWVGPSNISNLKNNTEESENEVKCNTSIITTDYAMQNVILQINIPLLSLDGKIITKVKTFVLECFSCWEIMKKPDIIFCTKCGKNTVLKVTCEYNQKGECILFRKKNKQIRVRGSKYSIPQPKGGRKVNDLILYEDDYLKPKVKNYLRKIESDQKKTQQQVNVDFDCGFGYEDINKSQKRFKEIPVGYGNKNPNVNAFQKNKNKKK